MNRGLLITIAITSLNLLFMIVGTISIKETITLSEEDKKIIEEKRR